MKERLEIVLCEKRKYSVCCDRLSGPKKNRRKDRSDDHRRSKICRHFGYVFRGRPCMVLLRGRVNTYGRTEIKMAENAKSTQRSSVVRGGSRPRWPAILTGPTMISRCRKTC